MFNAPMGALASDPHLGRSRRKVGTLLGQHLMLYGLEIAVASDPHLGRSRRKVGTLLGQRLMLYGLEITVTSDPIQRCQIPDGLATPIHPGSIR